MTWRTVLKWALAVILLWYAGILCLRMTVGPDETHPALPAVLHVQLRELAMRDLPAKEVRHAVQSLQLTGAGNEYVAGLKVRGDGEWILTCEPAHAQYSPEPTWRRILLLRFCRFRYPTLQVRSGCPEVNTY